MVQFRLLAATVTAAGLLAAMPAAAAVKIAKYSGKVFFGFDVTGVFTAPGTNLTGYDFVTTYTYDRTLGGSQRTDGVSYELSSGGTRDGNSSPIIASTIMINGVTRTTGGLFFGQVFTSTSQVQHDAGDSYADAVTQVRSNISNAGSPVGPPASLDQNFGPGALSFSAGFMQFSIFNFTTNSYAELAYANLNGDVYSVSDAVPEPESWALMIAGFGLVGTALRRRRAPAGVAA